LAKSIFEKDSDDKSAPELARKRQILTVASELFAHNGYSATVDQIAKKMGVTKGHIYYYFNSKQEILYQIFRKAMDFFMEEIEEANTPDFPVDQRLKAVLKSHIIAICENKDIMTVFMDLPKDLAKEYWEEIVVSRKKYERLIQELIKEGINKEYFVKENEKLLSYTILGSINWVYVWFQENAELSKEIVSEMMSSYLVNGLRNLHNLESVKLGKTIAEIDVNDSASLSKTISETDIYFFAGISGDYNPRYISDSFSRHTSSGKRTVHEGITSSLISPVINNILPGTGTELLESTCRHKNPVYPGDTITATALVVEKKADQNMIKMQLKWVNQHEEVVAEGEALVNPPQKEFRWSFSV